MQQVISRTGQDKQCESWPDNRHAVTVMASGDSLFKKRVAGCQACLRALANAGSAVTMGPPVQNTRLQSTQHVLAVHLKMSCSCR